MRGRDVNLTDLGRKQVSLLQYHYKHSIIEAWGSYELQRLLVPDFLTAGEHELALLYSLGEELFTPPPSSPAVNYFFQERC